LIFDKIDTGSSQPERTEVAMSTKFDSGSSQYFDTGLTYEGGAFTLEGWFYVEDLNSSHRILCIDDNGANNNNRQVQIYVGTLGNVNFDMFTSACSGTTQSANSASGVVSPNNWYYIQATWDGEYAISLKIRDVTGTVVGTGSVSATSVCSSGAERVTFGRYTQGGGYMTGRFRNIYWNDGGSTTDDNAALDRMFAANPFEWQGRTAQGNINFYPLRNSTDTTNLLGSDGTIPNGASTAAEIPAIPGNYQPF
jgi:hypothetical protein